MSVPAAWETTVRGPLHLIFEHDLAPLLEIRWQQPGRHASRRKTLSILRQFDEPADAPPRHGLPELPEHLRSRYEITALNESRQRIPSLLMVCRKCGATILIGLHRSSLDWLARDTPLLDSLRCCPETGATERWQIQDFFFTVPRGFELDSHAFQFGGSDLRFKGKHADLRICRLAPASEHLRKRRFAELFASFCSAPPGSLEVVDPHTLRYHGTVPMGARMWQRFRRKRPFIRATFSHYPDHDRILGAMVAGNRPADVDWGTPLENGYGIIQKTEAAGADP